MNPTPRVLVSAIALTQPASGVRRQAVELLPRVARLLFDAGGGLDVLVSSEGLPSDLDERLPPRVGRILTTVPPHGPFARALFESRATRRAVDAAAGRRAPYSLFHTGHLPAPKLDLPLSFLIHDLRDLTRGAATWRRLLAQRLLPATFRRASAIVTVSETMRAQLEECFPEAKRRIHVVSHGSDHLPVRPRKPTSINPEHRNQSPPILFFGHLERRRNPMLLVETLARHPELPPVVFAGSAKNAEDLRLRSRARELGVLGRLHFLGPIPESELPWLLATAGCLAIPSLVEGFGIPALEAQRAGLPLAVARTGALPEVAAPGTPLFDVSDPDACAAAIEAALAAPQYQLEAARAHAESYRWEASAESLFRVWESVDRPIQETH